MLCLVVKHNALKLLVSLSAKYFQIIGEFGAKKYFTEHWTDINSRGLSRHTKVRNSFFGKGTLNCRIRGGKVENLLWRAEKLEFLPAIRQTIIHCGPNNIQENTPDDIANGLLCSAFTIKKRNSLTNVYITWFLPRDFKETRMRSKIKKVNKLIREKCSSISTPRINYIEQDHDWIDEGNCLRTKYYYRDCLRLNELGNKKIQQYLH